MKTLRLSGLFLGLTLALAASAQQPAAAGGQIGPAQPSPTLAATRAANSPDVNSGQQQVASLLRQLDQAALSNNTAFFDQVLADDYQAVNPQGKKEDRSYVLQREKDMKYESINIVQGPYFQPQGDRVIESNVAQVKGTYKGDRFDGTYQSTRVWELRNGQWKIVSLQVNQVH